VRDREEPRFVSDDGWPRPFQSRGGRFRERGSQPRLEHRRPGRPRQVRQVRPVDPRLAALLLDAHRLRRALVPLIGAQQVKGRSLEPLGNAVSGGEPDERNVWLARMSVVERGCCCSGNRTFGSPVFRRCDGIRVRPLTRRNGDGRLDATSARGQIPPDPARQPRFPFKHRSPRSTGAASEEFDGGRDSSPGPASKTSARNGLGSVPTRLTIGVVLPARPPQDASRLVYAAR